MLEPAELQQFNFTIYAGIGKATDAAIKNLFPAWKDLLDADLAMLRSIKGVTPKLANDLQEQAFTCIKELRKAKGQAVDTATILPPREEAEGEGEEQKMRTREMIRTEHKLDAYTTIRARREITPSTCRECGFDVVSHYFGGASYEEVPEPIQERALKILEKHRVDAHTGAGQLIVTDEVADKQAPSPFADVFVPPTVAPTPAAPAESVNRGVAIPPTGKLADVLR